MQTWQIGEATITKVLEMENLWPGFAIIPEATPEAVLDHDWLLGPYADAESGRVRLSFHAFCIEVGDEKIVVDTCAGNDKVRPNFEALGGLQTDFPRPDDRGRVRTRRRHHGDLHPPPRRPRRLEHPSRR